MDNLDMSRKGGLVRAASLTAERRQEIARAAAVKRWSNRKPEVEKPKIFKMNGVWFCQNSNGSLLVLCKGRGKSNPVWRRVETKVFPKNNP